MIYSTFFSSAFGASPRDPYDYQCRLACGELGDKTDLAWLSSGVECQSRLINIPTGLGKTAAVVLAWLWNRVLLQRPDWPRRLVYCLPMRTLVEQTRDEVSNWLGALAKQFPDQSSLQWLRDHSPIVLMGGEDLDDARREWDIHPERDAILIGTQDMLLSRALNRGYGMSRYRWPMHFGLLNNDCLWVMDETQLMGVGVETSAQLDGFRHSENMPVVGACSTWWMSATLQPSRLATVDHPRPEAGWPTEALSNAEKASGRPQQLFDAPKALAPAPLRLNTETKSSYENQLAELIRQFHQVGSLTLVVLNRVSRAREVFQRLTGGKKPLYSPERVALIHSRFRPVDRQRHTELLFGSGDRIVIATQAVEAGVDVSARLLITELAPWSSLVQRMGRCNRRADIADAEVLWLDIQPKDGKDDALLPYAVAEMNQAREQLAQLTDVSSRSLSAIVVPESKVVRPVIRRRDLVDLFDTTPDICGQDLDVSRYIRDGEDSDMQFFWRKIEGDAPLLDEPQPIRDELCRVSIGDAAKFLKSKSTRGWRWNPLEKKWEDAKSPRPGAVYLVEFASGGYEDDLGWTGDGKAKSLTLHRPVAAIAEAHDGEPETFLRDWQTIAEHTRLVVLETEAVSSALGCETSFSALLRVAAFWHDVGKAHAEFQRMLCHDDDARARELWAKSAHQDGWCQRRGFRHELASALAWLLVGPSDADERDLIAYLIAAHHGKVRLSIRSLPNEPVPSGEGRLFARGIWQGDRLPAVPLGEFTTPEVTLDLSLMRMGEGPLGPSWLARTVALRDRFGPFHLAYLETVLRAADARASKTPAAPIL